ncbi:D-glycero-beta-D-manno-heptose 1,7-bisphosphate 7-phosphatase [Wielerella bovis]|uniref:D-glycero-beta-D-manno-heptose 1,7-bisphosphate 7-phosphatase n=1 Tax=Wielerella bovis TaxID=2917790 RepID=UPI002019440D|nr:D-glycero-beta-D-manno-heptose 1,7-bisphosphate 7-phosphatase [Wielerella bovis]ULJ61989.1 D-glycero-beta-D-manno-heptose 1,7-bisphosphate 7-phosphatase [Wielerella bovis]
MKLIILDRDGVINHDSDKFIKSTEEWQPIDGSMDAIAFLTQADYTVVVATNQSGIARGYFTVQTLNEMHNKMHKLVRQAGGEISGIWFCPHMADHHCDCRKPKAGMILDILDRFQAVASETYLVGDSLRDLQAINAVGGKAVLVKTGKGMKTLEKDSDKLPANTLIFDDLLMFAKYLVRPNQPSQNPSE